MYEIDPDITNGTCYYKAGAEADEEYSPAGNAELGHTFCCRLKDKLNSHNACVQETSKSLKLRSSIILTDSQLGIHIWPAVPITLTPTQAVLTRRTTVIISGWVW